MCYVSSGLYNGAGAALNGLYDGSQTVVGTLSDGILGLLHALYHGATYIATRLYYVVATPLAGIGTGLGYLTSGLFRVEEDVGAESESSHVQYESSIVEESGSYSGAGADIGAKYPTSSARRRSSRKSKLAAEAAAVARERLSRKSDMEDKSLVEEEEVITSAMALPGFTWSSWLFGFASAKQVEEKADDTDGSLTLSDIDDDADDDNIGLWLLSWISSFFVLLLSPISGIILFYC